MSDKKHNWKMFFSETNMRGIVARFYDAQAALNSSINLSFKVIHPGAIIVFCGILDEIRDEMRNLREQCEHADLDVFFEDQKMQEEHPSHD